MLLNMIETVDITKEIPLKYWIVFIIVMAVVLPVSYRVMTKLFLPPDDDSEPPIFSFKNRRKK